MFPIGTVSIAIAVLLFAGCSSLHVTSVADKDFINLSPLVPLKTILIVYDGADQEAKASFEQSFSEYFEQNTMTVPFKAGDLFPPLRKMTEQDRVRAIKDREIGGILLIKGGGSGGSITDWLYPGADVIDTSDPVWQQSQLQLFMPESGQVLWVASFRGFDGRSLSLDDYSRAFISAIGADLLREELVLLRTDGASRMRGFNK